MRFPAGLQAVVLFGASTLLCVATVRAEAPDGNVDDVAAPAPYAVYIVEPMAWRDLDCREYGGAEECPKGDRRVQYRLVEALRGPGWAGERAFDGHFSSDATRTARVLLVLRTREAEPEAAPIDRVAGGGWAYCGVPPGFEDPPEADAIEPIEFVLAFGDTRRLSRHGLDAYVERGDYAIVGHEIRCRRGVPLAALLRWLDAGRELW